jgi:hypothetical protein
MSRGVLEGWHTRIDEGQWHERLEKFSIVAACFHGCCKLKLPMLEFGK